MQSSCKARRDREVGKYASKSVKKKNKSCIVRILPTAGIRTAHAATPPILTRRRRGIEDNLLPNILNPLVLEKFRSRRPFKLIALETASHKVDAQLAELILGR